MEFSNALNLLEMLDSRKESKDIVINNPVWLISGIEQWCETEGNKQYLESDNYSNNKSELKLILPGRHYVISISDFLSAVLRDSTLILIDLIYSNPLDFRKGGALATASTVFNFINNLKNTDSNERNVLKVISAIKKAKKRGTKKYPTFEEIFDFSGVPSRELKKVLDSLIQKKIIKVDSQQYKISI